MARAERIDNEVLLQAGLELMRQNGKPLTRLPSKGRAMLFKLEDGQSVRARTCNDHILIAVADRPTEDAKLNIEGTDWLLIVMPEIRRTHGNVLGYLVPTEEAVEEVRRAHREWLATNPATKGGNTTWNLWFDHDGTGKANDYAEKWAKYRLEGTIATGEVVNVEAAPAGEAGGNLKAEVRTAQGRIARAAGVLPEAVRISIDFGG